MLPLIPVLDSPFQRRRVFARRDGADPPLVAKSCGSLIGRSWWLATHAGLLSREGLDPARWVEIGATVPVAFSAVATSVERLQASRWNG